MPIAPSLTKLDIKTDARKAANEVTPDLLPLLNILETHVKTKRDAVATGLDINDFEPLLLKAAKEYTRTENAIKTLMKIAGGRDASPPNYHDLIELANFPYPHLDDLGNAIRTTSKPIVDFVEQYDKEILSAAIYDANQRNTEQEKLAARQTVAREVYNFDARMKCHTI